MNALEKLGTLAQVLRWRMNWNKFDIHYPVPFPESPKFMDAWHAAFEGRFPEAHQDFLESLGITPQEIAAIRKRSACGGKDV